MPRKGRYLKRNAGTRTPKNLFFFDTESYREPVPGDPNKDRLTLRSWCLISLRLENGRVTRRKVYHGTSAEAFWRQLTGLAGGNACNYCFAHNLTHDCTQLLFWKALDDGYFTLTKPGASEADRTDSERRDEVGKLAVDGIPSFIVCYHGRATYKFVDTCNYWPKKLYDIGESIGLRKLPFPEANASDNDWQEYCYRDCQIIEYAVVSLLERWKRENSGVFQLTAAGLAMTNFRHTCDVRTEDGQSIDIVCNPGGTEHTIEREAYFGGRTTCYFVGYATGKIYHLDCNSLYPAVMARHNYPRRFARYQNGMTHDELQSAMRVYGVIARVSISSKHHAFPVRIDGQQYHCTGKYWTSLCGPELQRAIDTESIHRIGTVQLYSVAPLFAKWVSYWYNRKVEAVRRGSSGLADLEFAKLMLNSLSGKWAQRGRYWRLRPDRIPPRRWGGWVEMDRSTGTYEKWRAIAGNSQIQEEVGEPPHAFPAISAFITSHAREYMRHVIEGCPPESVYYSATDSIICDVRGYESIRSRGLVDQTALGKFKVCGVYSDCTILGPNHYMLDGKEVCSGVLGKHLSSQVSSRTVEIWEGPASLIAQGPRSDVEITRVPVPKVRPDFRGEITKDGWWRPYRLTLDPEWTDRPPSASYLPAYLLGNQEVHILQDAAASGVP